MKSAIKILHAGAVLICMLFINTLPNKNYAYRYTSKPNFTAIKASIKKENVIDKILALIVKNKLNIITSIIIFVPLVYFIYCKFFYVRI